MSDPSKNSAWRDWPLDREIVLARVIDAPRNIVYAAWTAPEQIQAWFGPDGMAIETREIGLKPGGLWRFDMVAPDGTRYSNRMIFLRMEAPALIEVEHGSDQDDDPGKFRMLVTFDEQSNGKTVITLRQMHPSKAQRNEKIGFGAVEYGGQTLDKLALHIAKLGSK
ncbi:Activator of Hsp90 ATPase 1 family protein [Parvibaculum lavamentivorans DS-1]|uniref:Activator of Hsp90 ATPase 1 family protein n=1 Tax=Parvibaculum lavamentivorans (strain DS-1 / DSM 13023 / NCIMB 13966) TaxID=402881 RepID=A7HXA5_PARL1|nr:SRPBCC family protein [Parvibaculum lavamentivorans]ABS64538.1 Activator of Hsp90 ATPase 1 family protein [Parvibaculum lavamentivorans DS-1]